MPLKKLIFKPGVNRENTRYTTEGGWYDCDKVRFRQGYPEKIGGWQRISNATFLGVCRSLWTWIPLGGQQFTGVGTNSKFYVESGGVYNDITPLRATEALAADPFSTTITSTEVTVTDAAGGYTMGDFVTFSAATAVGGLTLNGEYEIITAGATTYTITAASAATSTATGGGASVSAAYQINIGAAAALPLLGWGASGWGSGTWGVGEESTLNIRLWAQANFGEDLIFGFKGGPLYYWDVTGGLTSRAVLVSSLAGASAVPTVQNMLLISDVSRFVFVFGSDDVGVTAANPMLVRWSDQENAVDWTPTATNQAGSLILSHGAKIVSAIQARQEVLVWTDSAVYSLQYVGAPVVWGAQLVGDNISMASGNATIYVYGVAYWMGRDKFYKYDGRTQSLRCDLRKFIFEDFNPLQYDQVFAGTLEAYSEVWWFYCSTDATEVDRYVVYNYEQDIWYYGSMARTAWLDTGLRTNPIAATYSNNIVSHESGVDDNATATPTAINAYITSSEIDLEDGHQFSFIWRILPDMSFSGSTADTPAVTMTLYPLKNSGSGYTNPASVGGVSTDTVTRSVALPIQEYTGQINTRVRGRQLAVKVESDALGVQWQLGSPRIDIRPDGRR